MDNFKIDSRRLTLLKRSNLILEKTKTNYKKYENERRIILELTESESTDYDEWENILKSIEELVNSDSK